MRPNNPCLSSPSRRPAVVAGTACHLEAGRNLEGGHSFEAVRSFEEGHNCHLAGRSSVGGTEDLLAGSILGPTSSN